jgi:phospholipase C
MKYAALIPLLLAVLVVSCSNGQQQIALPQSASPSWQVHRKLGPAGYIQHVVVIMQENRTPDDLFQGLLTSEPGDSPNIQPFGILAGKQVALKQTSLATSYDLGHGHKSFVLDYDCGANDGFSSQLPPQYQLRPYSFAPLSEVQPYDDMATQFVFGDNMFHTQQAGSFPAHQYIVSASGEALPMTTDIMSSDPFHSSSGDKAQAGCDGPADGAVDTINQQDGSAGPTPRPCFNKPVLTDFLDLQGVSWRYYQVGTGPGLWHAFDAIRHVRYGPDYANVVTPPATILSDVATGALPGMSWVMPADSKHSDHPGNRSNEGPSWVAAVVNAIGGSQYWNNTAIVVIWDEWGGFYDHVPPPMMNNYMELGFRVPLLVISPYAKQGYVSHVQYEFGSVIAFAEETFGIRKGALGATDVRANDLADAFDFTQQPRPFVTISAPPFNPDTMSPKSLSDGTISEDPDNDPEGRVHPDCMTVKKNGHAFGHALALPTNAREITSR